MKYYFVLLLCILSAVSFVEAKKWRSYIDLHRFHEQVYLNFVQEHGTDDLPPYQLFNQTLNHFDEQDQRTWAQRYLVNDTFWNGTGPVFFMINGEAEMTQTIVLTYQFVTWAKEFNALVVSLEHRFYGESQPFDTLATKNLVYLDADQALADAANFRQFIAEKYHAKNNQFIMFGGSYAGELSGWMRLKYPHLISASVASSAPVNAEIDFYQYFEVVQDSLEFYGSAQCVQNIAKATEKIQAIANSNDGLTLLTSMLNTCNPIQEKDLSVLMQSLAGHFMAVAQSNLEFPGANISTWCDYMTNPNQDPLSNYLDIWNLHTGGECMDVSYDDMIFELQNTTIIVGAGGRPWVYQTCIEFGYFQTSESPNQPFGNMFNDVFGFDFLPDVNWTKTEYGANNPAGSNILWVNGLIDPWHVLGVLEAPHNILVINGTAHCADMLQPFAGSPPSLVAAQEIIKQQLSSWISAFNENQQ